MRRRRTYREDDHNGWRNYSGRRNNSKIAGTSPRTTLASKQKSETLGKGHNEPRDGETSKMQYVATARACPIRSHVNGLARKQTLGGAACK